MAQTIVVTGASRGIGLAVAEYILAHGHNIVITARSQAGFESIQAKAPKQVRILAADITQPSTAQDLVNLAESAFGDVHGLVINHGALEPVARLVDAELNGWKQIFDVNVFSAVGLIEAFLPALRKTRGRVVFTSSGAAVHSYSGWGPYCASKAALKSVAETLCVEEKGVTSVSIRPGTVDTDMQLQLRDKHLSVLDEADQKKFGSLKKEGKLLRPDQPGNVIARLALEASHELSGKFLNWDSEELARYRD